jgi:hypothetical protein
MVLEKTIGKNVKRAVVRETVNPLDEWEKVGYNKGAF